MNKLKRKYNILKARLNVWLYKTTEKVFSTLAKMSLVVEHKRDYTHSYDLVEPKPAHSLELERAVFDVSYLIRKTEFHCEHWFENKLGEKLFIVHDDHHTDYRICYRAELKSFFAHFSHKDKRWIHRGAPMTQIAIGNDIKYHRSDFSKCRYALEFTFDPNTLNNHAEEVLNESYRVLRNGLNEKIVEINTLLTGTLNDGSMTSKNGMPLSDNIVCRYCGFPVFASSKDKYAFECIHHGEIEYIDCDKLDPKKYEEVLSNCMTELEIYCVCPQD